MLASYYKFTYIKYINVKAALENVNISYMRYTRIYRFVNKSFNYNENLFQYNREIKMYL